ncbi:MAG: rod shape-determining protein MreC, partial [bacterium]
MRRSSGWFSARRDFLTLLTAIIVSLSFMFSNDGGQIETLRVWTLGGFGFLLKKISAVKAFKNVYEENHRLRHESAELMLENSRLKEALLENQRLRQLLNFKAESHLDLVAAKVIGKQESGFVNAVVLDVGKREKITRNMAVVTAQGLVGRVLEVSNNQSIVELLLDRNLRASAMVQRSRVAGIIKWVEGELVQLAEIPKRSDVQAGDTIITSEFSSIFP